MAIGHVPDVPDALLSEFARHNVILFIGAGISKGYRQNGVDGYTIPQNLPAWSELLIILNNLAKQENDINETEWEEIKEMIASGKLIHAAEILNDELRTVHLHRAMANIFRKREYKPNQRHQKIINIPAVGVITTNYDRLLETAYTRNTHYSPNVYTSNYAPDVIFSLREHTPFIFKIHGDIQSMKSVVISKSDYRRLMYREPAYIAVLTTIFLTKTVLFLGTGLADPEIEWILETVNENFRGDTVNHYALVPENEAGGTMERQHYKKDMGIELLTYEPLSHDRSEVDLFLDKLVDATAHIQNPFITYGYADEDASE